VVRPFCFPCPGRTRAKNRTAAPTQMAESATIEGRPVGRADIDIQKINHLTQAKAVDHVTQGARQD